MGANGGKRIGAGRKTKAEELGLAATLDQVFTPQAKLRVFNALLKEAEKGSKPHAELLLAYYYGKPTEHIISEGENELIVKILRDDGTNSEVKDPSSGTETNTEGG